MIKYCLLILLENIKNMIYFFREWVFLYEVKYFNQIQQYIIIKIIVSESLSNDKIVKLWIWHCFI